MRPSPRAIAIVNVSFFIVLCFVVYSTCSVLLCRFVIARNEAIQITTIQFVAWIASSCLLAMTQSVTWGSTNHHLLHLHVVAIDEAEHVDAGGLVEMDFGIAVESLAIEHTAHHIDHL